MPNSFTLPIAKVLGEKKGNLPVRETESLKAHYSKLMQARGDGAIIIGDDLFRQGISPGVKYFQGETVSKYRRCASR